MKNGGGGGGSAAWRAPFPGQNFPRRRRLNNVKRSSTLLSPPGPATNVAFTHSAIQAFKERLLFPICIRLMTPVATLHCQMAENLAGRQTGGTRNIMFRPIVMYVTLRRKRQLFNLT